VDAFPDGDVAFAGLAGRARRGNGGELVRHEGTRFET
jgi:hypothetical protein